MNNECLYIVNLLTVQNIETYYASSQALFDVSLTINNGEVVALMGRNGVGKSTTIRSILNLTPAKTGNIEFKGKNIKGLASYKTAQLGIGLVPEGRRCFANLSVYENLIVTARIGSWDVNKIYQLFPRLAERKHQLAVTLSGGEQQMLAIGRALLTNSKLIILDEATEGLAPLMRQEIWSAIHQLRDQGQSLLVVDKTLKELLPVCNHCFILEKGKTVWSGKPSNLDHDIKHRYLGIS
ncbi:MAG: ABC transporter ATP-binding protein [Cocleimonas sp.]